MEGDIQVLYTGGYPHNFDKNYKVKFESLTNKTFTKSFIYILEGNKPEFQFSKSITNLYESIESGNKKISFDPLKYKCKNLMKIIRTKKDITSKDFEFEVKEFDTFEEYIKCYVAKINFVKVEELENGKWKISPCYIKKLTDEEVKAREEKREADLALLLEERRKKLFDRNFLKYEKNKIPERYKDKTCLICLHDYKDIIEENISITKCCNSLMCEGCCNNYVGNFYSGLKCPNCRDEF